jgi:hypothetical protein
MLTFENGLVFGGAHRRTWTAQWPSLPSSARVRCPLCAPLRHHCCTAVASRAIASDFRGVMSQWRHTSGTLSWRQVLRQLWHAAVSSSGALTVVVLGAPPHDSFGAFARGSFRAPPPMVVFGAFACGSFKCTRDFKGILRGQMTNEATAKLVGTGVFVGCCRPGADQLAQRRCWPQRAVWRVRVPCGVCVCRVGGACAALGVRVALRTTLITFSELPSSVLV